MAQNQDNVLTLNNKPNVQIENNEIPLIGSDIRFNNQSQSRNQIMSPNTQVQTYSQVPLNFGGQDISSRLMNTNIVRIYPKTVKEFCKDPKHLFDINTIDRRDDFNKENENETIVADVV